MSFKKRLLLLGVGDGLIRAAAVATGIALAPVALAQSSSGGSVPPTLPHSAPGTGTAPSSTDSKPPAGKKPGANAGEERAQCEHMKGAEKQQCLRVLQGRGGDVGEAARGAGKSSSKR